MSLFRFTPYGHVRDWLTRPWREPTLEELLSEPIIIALMDADGVDPEELEAMLGRTSAKLGSRRAARTRRAGSAVCFCARVPTE
jgi:hypothetical protein